MEPRDAMTSPLQVVIVVLGSGGDVYPMMALGAPLVARGHQVHFVSSPHFGPRARAAGFTFHACATEEDERRALQTSDLWKPLKGFRLLLQGILDNLPTTYRLICDLHVPGQTIILSNSAALAARVARETLGIPLVTTHLQPIQLRSLYVQPGVVVSDRWTPIVSTFRTFFLPAVDRWLFDPIVAPTLNAFRGTFGLPPVRRVYDKWIHSPDLVLGLFPEWFAAPQRDWPAHTHLVGFPRAEPFIGAELGPELESYLKAGPPPIVFTAGTSMTVAHQFFDAAVEASKSTGRRALLLTQYAEQLPALPDHVRHVRFAPFDRLLPRAAALVHHGGIGTMAAAFAAGIPQLVVPFNFDQPDNAARLRALGAGTFIRPGNCKGPQVARALDRLLTSSSVATTCQAIAERMRHTRFAADAADLIEEMARTSVDAARAQAS
jgi:rhamnosyltransferase subunit B